MIYLSQVSSDKMLVFEAKLQGTSDQYGRLDEAIRTGRFVRNMCLRYWLDGHAKHRNDLNKYCKLLADNPEFPWVKKLNSMARQAMAERTWAAISRFFDNCKKKIQGLKGFRKDSGHRKRDKTGERVNMTDICA
jgi:putative transposase